MSAITGYDVWGTVAGILGTLGLIPILSSIINDQLPSTKLRILDETFFDTECLLRSVSEEGLFLNSNFIAEKEGRLLGYVPLSESDLPIYIFELMLCLSIHRQAEEYRTATYCATTFVKQLKVMMKGLSKKISLLCVEVKEVRASISVGPSSSPILFRAA